MNEPAKRDARGRLLPGSSANPFGRPRVVEEIRQLAREHAPAALRKVGELIGNADPRVALAASTEILNRVYGRPVQAIESDVRTMNLSALYLAATKLANGHRAPTVIDALPADEPVANATNQADDAW